MVVNKEANDDLYNEVLQHSIACVKHVKHFQGRSELIESVKNYLQGDNNLPLIVYGESGSGKTSILAKAAYLARSWLGDEISTNSIIFLKFLGTSPGTSNIRQTIRYLCRQLLLLSGEDETASKTDDFKELIQTFYQTLDRLSEYRKIIIFLDSLDQLQPADGAFTLSWLVTPLRPNVKMVLSTLPKHENILDNIRLRFEDKALFLEVKQLEQTTCMDILLSLLQEKERTVTEQQKIILMEAFNACSLPIYVNLVFRTVIKWRSYHDDQTNKLSLKFTVREAIFQFVKNLEKMYNKTFVRHSLAYITASRNGLSEAELEDILSLDNTVLRSIFIYHLPPQIRVPPFLWSRIRQEIGSYLVEREADNCRVLYWYHRQFIEVAKEYLLDDRQFRIYIHDNMADYFLGTYANNKPKRFYYPPNIVRKLNLPPYTDEGRNMPNQPFIYNQERYANNKNSAILYNYRKINELPWHLAKAGRLAEFGDCIAFNYEYIIAKLRISSRSSLLEDLSLIDDHNISFQKSLTLLYNAIRLSVLSLSQDPSNISFDLVGRLSKYDNICYPRIMDLLEQCRSKSYLDIGFIPTGQCLESGSGLLYLWYDIGLCMGIVLPNNQLMTVSMVDTSITYYDTDGNIVKTVQSDVNIFMGLKMLLSKRPTLEQIISKMILQKKKKSKKVRNESNQDHVSEDEENEPETMVHMVYDLNIYSGKLTEVKELPHDVKYENIMEINDTFIQIDSRLGMAKLWNFKDDHYVYEFEKGVIHACLGLDDKSASVMYEIDGHAYLDVITLENEQIISLGIVPTFKAICCFNDPNNMVIVMFHRNENIYFFHYLIQDCTLQYYNIISIESFKHELRRVKICALHDSNIVIFFLQRTRNIDETVYTTAFVYKKKSDSILCLILDNKTSVYMKHTKAFGDSVQCVISEDEELLITSGDKCLLLSWSLIDGSLLQVITLGTAEGLLSGIFTNINKVAICHFPDESYGNADEKMYILVKLYNIEDLRKPMTISESTENDVEILEEHPLFNHKDYKYRDVSYDPLDGLLFMDNFSKTFLIDTSENYTIKSKPFSKPFLNLSLINGNNDRNDIIFKIINLKSNTADTFVVSNECQSTECISEELLDSSILKRINPRKFVINENILLYNLEEFFPGWIISFINENSRPNFLELSLQGLHLKNSRRCTSSSFTFDIRKMCEEYNNSCLTELKIKTLSLSNIAIRNNHKNQIILVYRSKDRKYDDILKNETNKIVLWSGVIIILEVRIERKNNDEYVLNHNLVNFTTADIGNGLALLKDGNFGINYKLEKIDLITGEVVDKIASLETNTYILYPILVSNDRFLVGTKLIGPYRVSFSIGLSDEIDEDMFAVIPPRTLMIYDIEKNCLIGNYPFENQPETIILSRNNTILSTITINEPIRCLKINLFQKKDVRIESNCNSSKNGKRVNQAYGYLKVILTEAFREVLDKRPSDPITFLATYLRNI